MYLCQYHADLARESLKVRDTGRGEDRCEFIGCNAPGCHWYELPSTVQARKKAAAPSGPPKKDTRAHYKEKFWEQERMEM